ncbi:hypothetical protein HK097_011506, partial [Rhizophlyctis rosea]
MSNPKEEEKTARPDRRMVFKHTFDSPFTYKWPIVAQEDEEAILKLLCQTLSPIGDSRRKQSAHRIAQRIQLKRKAVEEAEASSHSESPLPDSTTLLRLPEGPKKKKRKSLAERASSRAITFSSTPFATTTPELDPTTLQLRKDLLLGVNAVTKALEPSRAPSQIQIIFLFRGDIPIPHLYAHFPTMTYLAAPECLLFAFGMKGAEKRVAESLGIKRVSCLGVKTPSETFTPLHILLKSKISLPIIPWLPRPTTIASQLPQSSRQQSASETKLKTVYVPTNVKTLQIPGQVFKFKNRNDERKNVGGGG